MGLPARATIWSAQDSARRAAYRRGATYVVSGVPERLGVAAVVLGLADD